MKLTIIRELLDALGDESPTADDRKVWADVMAQASQTAVRPDDAELGRFELPSEREVRIFSGQYGNGCTAVYARDDEGIPEATISINVETAELDPGEFVVNHDIPRDQLDSWMASGVFRDTGRTVDYGFVRGQPVWELLKEDDE